MHTYTYCIILIPISIITFFLLPHRHHHHHHPSFFVFLVLVLLLRFFFFFGLVFSVSFCLPPIFVIASGSSASFFFLFTRFHPYLYVSVIAFSTYP
jgi:hypothetical protein